ncbi:ABC transporter permease [Aliikangiella maris]|uniref:FtsX-like permease family protein n=2 Tax=Aliikangiella maris TaxID=3162458 RepID=A0ABV3MRM7_9GAMM
MKVGNGLLFNIALRIFKRDWHRGDLLVLLFAMCISMASISVIYLIIDRIESATEREAADILGADLVISSPQEINPQWLSLAQELNLEQALSVEFSSVLFANDKLQLSSIKAVSDNYPLKGRVEIADTPYAQNRLMNRAPDSGKIWVEPRIFNMLEIQSNQAIELGYANFQFAGVLMLKPGQGNTLFNVSPSAIINVKDLPTTQVIQPGSRIYYQYLFAGEPSDIQSFAAKLKLQITTSQRLRTVYDESPVAGSAITRSKQYIGLSSLLTMILLGVTIAMSANRYARRQFDTSALMRSFGMTNTEVLKIFALVLIFVCVSGVLVGSLLGIIIQEVIVFFFAEQFVDNLPAANYAVLALPLVASIILLFGFSFPSLIQIKAVSPMRVLRRQLTPMGLNGLLVYSIAVATITFVMWLQAGNIKLILTVILGLAGVTVIFTLFAVTILKILKKMAKSNSAAVNFSLRQLEANKNITLLHLLAFSITLFVIALIVLIKSELLTKWQQSLGNDLPNHFMVNIKPDEVPQLQNFFEQNHLTFSGLYPMIRGRIVGINGEDIKTAVSEEGQQHNSLRRELNITWSESLPKGNEIVDGNWQWQDATTDNQISIEEKTAKALELKIGDTLNFIIGSQAWNAQITSIRSIDWETFTPNFYIITKPGNLEQFSATYISSFRLPKLQKPLLAELVKTYPSITIVELDLILEEVQSIIHKVSGAVQLIMIFVVTAGMGLLWAALEHTFEAKYRHSAILRTLGASKSFIVRSFRFEYLWLALLSSVMAIAAVETISYFLYQQVFEIPFEIHWELWAILPAATIILMLLASWRGVKRVTSPSPMVLLRQGDNAS